MIYDNTEEDFKAITNIHTRVVKGIFLDIHQSHKQLSP